MVQENNPSCYTRPKCEGAHEEDKIKSSEFQGNQQGKHSSSLPGRTKSSRADPTQESSPARSLVQQGGVETSNELGWGGGNTKTLRRMKRRGTHDRVPLPVDQELELSSSVTDVQDAPDCVGRPPIHNTGGRDQIRLSDRLHLGDVETFM
ncbi:hypothetical protein D4764_18G0002980 [Takifugu flavidus]|uniref:Uncharacterized protein n=1 Tax=Takifugu flavidus TaxID=433684 RepID=A0A5C6NPE4_9TELE|nr:hypothetical protein D4764_18G0002980 [Takifugu flavidus]